LILVKKFFPDILLKVIKVENELTEIVFLELLIAVLLKASSLSDDGLSTGMRLKRFNILFKALDIYTPDWLSSKSEFDKMMETDFQSILQAVPEIKPDSVMIDFKQYHHKNNYNQLKVIPLTVLFYEGPIARAYLETIKSLGFQPARIIELVSAKDIVTKKSVGKWLPKGMRQSYAASIQRSKIHYWPKYLLKSKADFIHSLFSEVQEKFGFSRLQIDNAHSLLPLSNYSQSIESLLIEDLKDVILNNYLTEEVDGAVLYTGGGIVPAELLNIEQLKFLHIHPGYLPDIRGADCALWSLLLAGNVSASCFYMSPDIDGGEIIQSQWLPEFSMNVDITDIDHQSLYRVVYAFLDPWIRSFVLREVINHHEQFSSLSGKFQSKEDGIMYHFMHPKLKAAAFQKLFCK